MRVRRARIASLAVLLALGAVALALALTSVGRAGSGPKEFDFFAQPTILSQDSNGVAWGRFKPISGGAATHVVISVTIPSGFEFVAANSSPGCAPATAATTFECVVGTVNPGQTVKRYVGFHAPATLPPGPSQPFSGKVRFDNGAGGGGGAADELTGQPVSVTVVTAPDGDRDGGCSNLLPRTDNVELSNSNLVSTEIRSGTPLASLGLTCTWAFVGETSGPSGNSLSPISFFGFPQTEPGAPVEQVVTIYKLPVPFKNLKVLFSSTYIGPGDDFDGSVLPRCTGPDNSLGANQPACLKSLVKLGPGAQAIILARGTGADPGSGFG